MKVKNGLSITGRNGFDVKRIMSPQYLKEGNVCVLFAQFYIPKEFKEWVTLPILVPIILPVLQNQRTFFIPCRLIREYMWADVQILKRPLGVGRYPRYILR